MYWLAHVLLCADDDGEDNKDDGSVEVVQAVDPVIIVATFQPGVGRKTPENTVKPNEDKAIGIILLKTVYKNNHKHC